MEGTYLSGVIENACCKCVYIAKLHSSQHRLRWSKAVRAVVIRHQLRQGSPLTEFMPLVITVVAAVWAWRRSDQCVEIWCRIPLDVTKWGPWYCSIHYSRGIDFGIGLLKLHKRKRETADVTEMYWYLNIAWQYHGEMFDNPWYAKSTLITRSSWVTEGACNYSDIQIQITCALPHFETKLACTCTHIVYIHMTS